MAIVYSAGELPRGLALLAGGGGLFVGFFSFIFSCVLEANFRGGSTLIMLAMVLCACGLLLLLGAVNVFTLLQNNIHVTVSIAIFGIVISFIKLVIYSIMARAYNLSVYLEAYFAVSIVLILLLFALILGYIVFVVILVKNLGTMSTTVTSTTRTTTTTIETPPGYTNEASQVPK